MAKVYSDEQRAKFRRKFNIPAAVGSNAQIDAAIASWKTSKNHTHCKPLARARMRCSLLTMGLLKHPT